MIEWTPIAQRLGYLDEEAMWKDLYDTKRKSISQLSTELGVSRNTIRSSLERRNVKVRGRGGANNHCVELTQDVIDEIKKNGVMAVAKRLDLNYTTLYKRLRKLGMTVADLQRKESTA